MAYVIRNENKVKLILAMGKEPAISGSMIAEELGVTPVTVYRWMQEPSDAQFERMMQAIESIRKKEK